MFGLSRDLIKTVNSSPVIQFLSTDTSSIMGEICVTLVVFKIPKRWTFEDNLPLQHSLHRNLLNFSKQ